MQEPGASRVETLAKIGASLLAVQCEAAALAPADIDHDAWRHGYSFGFFEAMAQYADLDQYGDGREMIASAFGKLVDEASRGDELFRGAVASIDDPRFSAGAATGAADLMAWAADAEALPTGLARRGRAGES